MALVMFSFFRLPSEVAPKTSMKVQLSSAGSSSHADAAKTQNENSHPSDSNSLDIAEKQKSYSFSWSDLVTQGEWLLIECSGLILCGGLLIAYCERSSYDELAKQYERMAKIFTQGEKEIARHLGNDELTKVQDVLADLGREAIMENAQWLILRRNRPFELLIQ
jgi:hypothetical protein